MELVQNLTTRIASSILGLGKRACPTPITTRLHFEGICDIIREIADSAER